MAKVGEGMQADSSSNSSGALRGPVPYPVTHPLLLGDFVWPKQGLHASAVLSLSG